MSQFILIISGLGHTGSLLTSSTAFIKGLQVTLFCDIPIIGEGVSGVARKTASTASTPWTVACDETIR